MEILGLIFELFFLAMAIYIYLFAIGKVTTSDEKISQKSADFREKNAHWLRPAALAMIAIMLVNIVLHLQYLWTNL